MPGRDPELLSSAPVEASGPAYPSVVPSILFGLLGAFVQARSARARGLTDTGRYWMAAWITTAVGLAVGVWVAVFLVVADGSSTSALDAPTGAQATPTAIPSVSPAGLCSYPTGGSSVKALPGTPPAQPLSTPQTATLTTNLGPIAIQLHGAEAPCTVNSLQFLAQHAYYDGTVCHRLTTDNIFVLQCGDPSGTGGGGPGYAYEDEALEGATYPAGTVAMANAGPGTNGSQFFLVYKDTQLPPHYTPFGTITSGMDVIKRVAAAGSNPPGDGAPVQPVRLKTVTVD